MSVAVAVITEASGCKKTTTAAPTIIANRINFFFFFFVGLYCQIKPNSQKYTKEKPQIYTHEHTHTHVCCTRTVDKI